MAVQVMRQEDGSARVVNQKVEDGSQSKYLYLIRGRTKVEAEGIAKSRGLLKGEWRYMPRNGRNTDGLFTTRDRLIGDFTPEEVFIYTGTSADDTSPDVQNDTVEA